MEKNPFLEKEDKEDKEEKEEKEEKEDEEVDSKYCEIRKPFRKEELTEAQKARNFKGLKMMKEAIKKARPYRAK